MRKVIILITFVLAFFNAVEAHSAQSCAKDIEKFGYHHNTNNDIGAHASVYYIDKFGKATYCEVCFNYYETIVR